MTFADHDILAYVVLLVGVVNVLLLKAGLGEAKRAREWRTAAIEAENRASDLERQNDILVMETNGAHRKIAYLKQEMRNAIVCDPEVVELTEELQEWIKEEEH